MYGLLEELPGAPHRSEHEWAAEDARTVGLLEQPLSSWPHLIVANVLLDQALAYMLDAAVESRYLPLRQRTRKLIEEERFHAIHGQGWLLQLAAEGPEVRVELEGLIRQAWADTLCWFGPDAGGALAPLVTLGVLREAGESVRQRFLQMFGPLLHGAGLAAPVRAEGGRWVLAEPLPWSRWDEARRRVQHA